MKAALFASCAAGCALLLSAPALAQTAPPAPTSSSTQTTSSDAPVGKQAGTFMLRLRAIGVLPEDNSSSTSVGGHVRASDQFAPEADISYFFTDNIAAELIAATTRHDVRAIGTAAGDVKVGSTWVLPPTLTLQYHFMPHQRFSPYIGAGVNATFFYSASPSHPIVHHVLFSNGIAPAVQVGADYNLTGHWFLNADIKQIFLDTNAKASTVLGLVRAKTSLDPLVVGVGAGYRF
jgi:outer membrane protein